MLTGKTAVVTGGGRGIGRAITVKLAENGANVAVIYAGDEQAAEEAAKSARQLGVQAAAIRCDVSDFDACKAAVAQVTKTLGPIDILVNNAGITRDGLVFSMGREDFQRVLDVNLTGAFNMIKHCYPGFIRKKQGKIINISSVAGLMGNAGQANYAASKAGLIGLTKSLARELAGRNICVNAIAPGFIETEMTAELGEPDSLTGSIPMRRIGTPEDVANLALFLAGDQSGYITGEVIRVDGGMAM